MKILNEENLAAGEVLTENGKSNKRFKALLLSLLVITLVVSCGFILKSAAHDGAKEVPLSFIVGFEERFIRDGNSRNDYELIETIDFGLSKSKPSQVYYYESKNKGEAIVFSFTQTSAPVNFSLLTKADGKEYKGGFSGESAVKVKLNSNSAYEFKYELGFEDELHRTQSIEKPVDFVSGKMNVYKMVK